MPRAPQSVDATDDATTLRASTPPSAPPAASPSKGPPPLPQEAALLAFSRDSVPVEEVLFQEGIDGHVESVPPSGRHSLPLEEPSTLVRTGAQPMPAVTSLEEQWLELDEEQPEEETEDPARARRRRVARIGTAWGMVVAIAVVGAGALRSARTDLRSAATSPPPANVAATIARPSLGTPALTSRPSQGHSPLLAAVAPAPAVRATTAAASATVPANLRTAARSSAPSPVARPAPRASGARGARARHPQPKRSAVHKPAARAAT